MALIPKFYMQAVVSIGIENQFQPKWIATGFIVRKKVADDLYLIFLVTNKHVLYDKEKVYIRLKENDSEELKIIELPLIFNGTKIYSEHPDPNIDIAVVTLNAPNLLEKNVEIAAFDIDENALSSSEFWEDGGDEGTFVYMLGYPMSMVDIDTTAPICRAGCIARMDPKEINSKKRILLDIQNFPGNSGSPIINKPEVAGIEGTLPLNKSSLIGIVCAYIPYKEPLMNMQTNEIVETRSENSGLAIAHPVEFIRDVIALEIQRDLIEYTKEQSNDDNRIEEGAV